MIAQVLVKSGSRSPKPPRFPNLWIDPALLQLVGLGTKADPYLPDGHHLRWFFGRLLGFPRTSFALWRRRGLTDLKSERLNEMYEPMGVQMLTEDELGADADTREFQSGLTVRKQGGFVYGSGQFNSSPALLLDEKPVLLDLGPQTNFQQAQLPTNPAAYVLLVVAYKAETGHATALGYYNDGDEFRLQDTARAGHLPSTTPSGLTRRDKRFRLTEWLFSSQPTTAYASKVPGWKEAAQADMEFKEPAGCLPFGSSDEWVVDTLLLQGGLLEHVELTGKDAVVGKVQWLPSRLYAQLDGWEGFQHFYLPLTNLPQFYPAWTSKTGEQVARERLLHAPPHARAPWDEPAHPPPHAPAPVVTADLEARYLGNAFKRINAAMMTFVVGEVLFQRPQALVEFPETLHWEGADAPAGSVETFYTPFDFLYNAAIDPHMARLLGLMTSDTEAPSGHWDYMVNAAFPAPWAWMMLVPSFADLLTEHYKKHGIGGPSEFQSAAEAQGQQGTADEAALLLAPVVPVASLATGVIREHAPLPSPPREAKAVPRAKPVPAAVQAEVEVSWRVGSENFYFDPQHAQIFYALRRKGGSGDVPVHHLDEELKIPLPHVPSAESLLDSRARVTDRSLPAYGSYTWLVSGMDIWGRFSPFAEAAATVKDEIAPPAPSKVAAELIGDTDGAPTWQSLQIGFDWTSSQQKQAPDLAAFELHVRQGKIPKADSQLPQTWGRLEHEANATTPPLRVAWPTGDVNPPGSSLGATVVKSPLPAEEGGATRWTIKVGPVSRPFDDAGYAQMSATVTAVDASGNASPFASYAIATRADDEPPPAVPLLPGPQRSSYPDARARAFYRLPLKTPAGMRAQVMRASEVALLQAGNASGNFEQMNVGEKVVLLKQLALAHAEVFSPDHELPYDDTFPDHLLELNGNDRGWTVATLQHTSKTGIRAGWPAHPDCFVVVSVPAAVAPPVPLVREARPGDRQSLLRLAADPSGRTQEFRVYRTRGVEAAEDVRSMRPVLSAKAPTPTGEPAQDLWLTDEGLLPDVTYFYRVVGVGEGNVRSEPTGVIAVRPFSTQPPEASQVISVTRPSPNSGLRSVKWLVSRGDYRVTLFRRVGGGASWELTAAGVGPDGSLKLGSLSTAHTDAGLEVSLLDKVPDAQGVYSYFVRITDPRGRRADSEPLEEVL